MLTADFREWRLDTEESVWTGKLRKRRYLTRRLSASEEGESRRSMSVYSRSRRTTEKSFAKFHGNRYDCLTFWRPVYIDFCTLPTYA